MATAEKYKVKRKCLRQTGKYGDTLTLTEAFQGFSGMASGGKLPAAAAPVKLYTTRRLEAKNSKYGASTTTFILG